MTRNILRPVKQNHGARVMHTAYFMSLFLAPLFAGLAAGWYVGVAVFCALLFLSLAIEDAATDVIEALKKE